MPKYVIERPLPGAGKLSADELHAISAKSNQVLTNLGPEVRWLQSYVTEDKIYCVYVAPDEDLILEHVGGHGRRGSDDQGVRTLHRVEQFFGRQTETHADVVAGLT